MYKITLTVLALLASIVSAQIPGLPSCAQSCVGTSFGDCGALNVTCICSNQPLIDGLACCVSTACDSAGQASTIQFANALCAANAVDDLPQSATCASGASSTGSATSRVTPVPQGSSTDSSASATSSGAAASASSAGSSIASSISSAASSASSAAESAASSASSSATSAAGVASASASSAAGAVATVVGNAGFGLVVAGILAAL